jgi:hypothetical protein
MQPNLTPAQLQAQEKQMEVAVNALAQKRLQSLASLAQADPISNDQSDVEE